MPNYEPPYEKPVLKRIRYLKGIKKFLAAIQKEMPNLETKQHIVAYHPVMNFFDAQLRTTLWKDYIEENTRPKS
jgi:hypothetical protein